MNPTLLTFTVFVALVLSSSPPAKAQDGWLMSAKPPLVIRRDMETLNLRFTNTSDKILHGIKVTATKDGEQFSMVIIDTIKSHETASVDSNQFWAMDKDATITCVDYSKPIKLYQ